MSLTVLQIIPALGTGGAEQAVVEIAAGLLSRGDRALAVSSGGRRVRELDELGAMHILRDVKTKNPFKIIRNAYWLADLIRKEKVDIVHARSRAPAWSAYLACRMTGAHYMTTFHAAYKFKSDIKKAYNAVMAKGERVIAISPFIADHIYTSYDVLSDRLRLVNRGVDLANYNPQSMADERVDAARAAFNADRGREIIVLPGRLSPIKGQKIILRALGLLAQRRKQPMPLLLIIGDDQGREAYSAELLDLTREVGLADHVRFTGAWADMPAAYALASLVVVPSQVPEGFGRVPIEAMAMGVPVLVSQLGAMQDTVRHGQTGWHVPHDNVELWAAQIDEALSMGGEARRQMGQAGREEVIHNYAREVMVERTLAVYDELGPMVNPL